MTRFDLNQILNIQMRLGFWEELPEAVFLLFDSFFTLPLYRCAHITRANMNAQNKNNTAVQPILTSIAD